MPAPAVTVMGIFAADLSFRTERLPVWGETVIGSHFHLGPGGKGSNQAVAAARLGGAVRFISKVGADPFGELAQHIHREAGVQLDSLYVTPDHSTGAAAIIVDQASGENAIVVTPGAANALTPEDIDRARDAIARSGCFMTQLELSMPLVEHGLRLARSLGVPTILNPAPACHCSDDFLQLCDYLTPNESEASALTGMPVETMAQIERAAAALLRRGPRQVVITLGARGAFALSADVAESVEAFRAGAVLDTTGAGDAFNGGFAIGLAEGMGLVEATRFGCAAAGISVTRQGTATSMPAREEVDRLYRDYNTAAATK
ncbi:MAG TPA: ribokinase [Acidobacteriaceae bacterium]|jgi:ribokinase|nr:ribokinase [Acidobacteriaceae bacterium]